MKKITKQERSSELSFMTCAPAWPRWPFLPVKKRQEGGGFPTCGILFVDSLELMAPDPVVYEHEIFTGRQFNKEKVLARYESLEAMVDDGWVVD